MKDDDLGDLSETAKSRALEAETAGAHETVLKYQQWQAAVRAYLACIAFVDAQVGKLLDALDAGPNAAHTMIVLWGDHGWHLGEKQHWGKWTGWQRGTHVPLIIRRLRDEFAGYKIAAKCAEPVASGHLSDVDPGCGLLLSMASPDISRAAHARILGNAPTVLRPYNIRSR